MGASSWNYWVKYQPNPEKALQDLRQAVFLADWQDQNIDLREAMQFNGIMDEDAIEAAIRDTEGDPIARLLASKGFDGTHSVLDMISGVAEGSKDEIDWLELVAEGFGKVYPLSTQELIRMFGTDHPTHEQIENKMFDLMSSCPRYTGKYLVSYTNNQPDEILFVGKSGD